MQQITENEYQSYIKEINGEIFYFVKKFVVFPAVSNTGPMLTGYGMHRGFEKACQIAGVMEKDIQNKIRPDLPTARLVEFKNYPFHGQKRSV